MAAFPDSVKSFTTKNTGDVVQAAHINDLQDEVAAIEGGIRNGTAPINSSGSTLAALSVSGGSTLASLSVTGDSTLAGSLQAAGSTFSVRPVTPPPHAALVFAASSQTCGSSNFSTLAFGGQEVLTNSSMHSTTTNPERLTPQSTGLYAVTAQFTMAGTPSAIMQQQLAILDSSGNSICLTRYPDSTGPSALLTTGLKRFDALGGWVTCRVVSNGGSTYSASTGTGVTWFAMHKL